MTPAVEERRRTADETWRNVAFFLAGVVITMLGAWATHSVTQEQLAGLLQQRDALIYAKIAAVESAQQRIAPLSEKLDRLGDDMIKVKMALGITDTGEARRRK